MLNTTFAAAVLEGIEGTLDELIARIAPGDLRARLVKLQHETTSVRCLFDAFEAAEAAED